MFGGQPQAKATASSITLLLPLQQVPRTTAVELHQLSSDHSTKVCHARGRSLLRQHQLTMHMIARKQQLLTADNTALTATTDPKKAAHLPLRPTTATIPRGVSTVRRRSPTDLKPRTEMCAR